MYKLEAIGTIWITHYVIKSIVSPHLGSAAIKARSLELLAHSYVGVPEGGAPDGDDQTNIAAVNS